MAFSQRFALLSRRAVSLGKCIRIGPHQQYQRVCVNAFNISNQLSQFRPFSTSSFYEDEEYVTSASSGIYY